MITAVLIFTAGFLLGTFITWWTLEIEPKDSTGPG
jgi:hypothetical protein